MTMCIKRAGLVWALVLLTTTCFILTCAAPTVPKEPAEDEAITTTTTTAEPPAVSTTPPVKSTDEVDSSNNVMTDAPAVSERVPSNDDADGYLYYQIKKCIAGHNLTLGDIQYVLSQKDEEGQFMFALADKLGYMSDGTHNNPHIPVIRSHRENLIELFEKMAAMKESKSHSQQEHNEGPTVSSDETPASKEPASPSDSKKIGLKVSADIRELGLDAIQDILRDFSFSDTLGYTVGMALHYSPEGDHMKYLENADADELKKFLQRILKLKTASENENTPDTNRNEPTPSGRGHDVVDDNGGQRQGGERDPVNEGASEPSNFKSLLPQNDDDTQNIQKQTLPPTVKPPKKEVEYDLQVTKPSAKPGPEGGVDDANGAGGVSNNTGDPGDGDNHRADKVPDEKMKEKTSPNEGDSRGGDGDHNKVRPSPNNDDERMDGLNGINNDNGGFGQGIDKENLLNSFEFQNFLETEYNELYEQFIMDKADPNKIDRALEEYLELLSDSERSGVTKDEKGGDEDSSNLEAGDGDEPKAKEDSPDQPLDSNDQAKGALDSLGNEEDEVEYDHPRSSSSFGALHFLGIFLILGAVVIVGYLCMHNRKKLREGVATYIKDSSKRRRRAREYKPLIST